MLACRAGSFVPLRQGQPGNENGHSLSRTAGADYGDEPFRDAQERAWSHIFGLMCLLPARDSSGNPVYNRSHMKNLRCSC